ncbi:MAG TPA: cobaltochelatase subunit CobN [Steroidobacteraceae bacterium]
MTSTGPRVRVLVSADAADEAALAQWQDLRDASPHDGRVVLQRVARDSQRGPDHAVGLGYGETLRWFAPVADTNARRQVIAYAAAILEAGEFPTPTAELVQLAWPRSAGVATDTASEHDSPLTQGIVLLSHAETDLLALERARADLPGNFPRVCGYSLNAVDSPERLLALLGTRRSTQLVAIIRVHGAAAAVPGLAGLLAQAHEEGWSLVVISGIGGSAEIQPRTSNVAPELAANLTAYFMAGGVRNVAQALRCTAHDQLGYSTAFEPPQSMPAHGLYHPDLLVTDLQEWNSHRAANLPVAAMLFYRAHVLSGNLQFVDQMLRALDARGFTTIGVFTSSLRDRDATGSPLALTQLGSLPEVIVNTVSYPVLTLSSVEQPPEDARHTSFEALGAPLLQAICCGTPRATWTESSRGLGPVEAAMNIALPECDGRVITVPVSFKEQHRYVPDAERLERVADLARRLAILRRKANADKRIVVVLTNSGGKAQKIGGAIGLDTPASLLQWLAAMRTAGYDTGTAFESADALMAALLAQGTYDEKYPLNPHCACRMPRLNYVDWFRSQSFGFQQSLRDMWGEPTTTGPTIAPPFWRSNKQSARRAPLVTLHEPHTDHDDYLFGGLQLGNIFITIQPPRGFGVDPEAIYHAPDLPPCHHYAAFYRWIADGWKADAVVHFGTHGTLEWLPGKSLGMSADCAPDALLGDMPLFYPFVVNNPGEGAQAKRRTHAVIIDHLVPPLTHADTYGPLATLSRFVEEYYRAEVLDPSKLPVLRTQIWDLVRNAQLEDDLKQIRRQKHGDHEHPWDERLTEQGIPRALDQLSGRGFAHLLEDLDAYLCDLGRAQIRGGLHVFGSPPMGAALIDLAFAILRSPNGNVPALVDAVTRASDIDPRELRDHVGLWPYPLPPAIAPTSDFIASVSQLRTRIDHLARELLRELAERNFAIESVQSVIELHFVPSSDQASTGIRDLEHTLKFACEVLIPNLRLTTDETRHLMAALSGAYVPAGPSGSPSRGMAHVLPTGRNFYTVDPRGLPTPAAWATGSSLAEASLARHFAETQRWPESIALSVWGTPAMRTGGDDIAQALALLGVRPTWEPETRRTSGLEVVPLLELGRPRIDVTLRVSGFFRDAFPALMHLFDAAVQRVIMLDEPVEQNFVRKHWLAETATLMDQGHESSVAARRASYRVFSSKPGAYGTGLLELMDERSWRDTRDLADAVLLWGGWAYTPETSDGIEATEAFRRQLAGVDLALHTQDSREQDLFDASDYFEFHGGLVAAITSLANRNPRAYCGDSSDPVQPQVRTLQGEALRVYRSRVVNPKWLSAIQHHGYRGGMEMAATVDCLFGFAATTGIVTDWMFEGVAEHFAAGEARQFLQRSNPWALNAIAERLLEAEQRQLWNAQEQTLAALRETLLESEANIEGRVEDSP